MKTISFDRFQRFDDFLSRDVPLAESQLQIEGLAWRFVIEDIRLRAARFGLREVLPDLGPRGAAWRPSTIHGHGGRGTGILNNELYIGRRVWNRQRYIKDLDTGKRVSRRNPQSEWITRDVPSLRIVADEVWAAAKKRQADTRY